MSDNNNDQKTYKILVWGDSIGRQCEVPWPDRLQHSMQVSFYCGTDVEVVNIAECGLSGIWGQNYFEEKVKPENPDLVIIQFGFNDMRHDKAFGAHPIGTPDEYEAAMCNMIRNAKSIGAEVLVLGNHNFAFGNLLLYPNGMDGDQMVELYRQRAENAAKKEGADYINMNDVFANNGLTSIAGTVDGCHLSDNGARVYTYTVQRYVMKKLLA